MTKPVLMILRQGSGSHRPTLSRETSYREDDMYMVTESETSTSRILFKSPSLVGSMDWQLSSHWYCHTYHSAKYGRFLYYIRARYHSQSRRKNHYRRWKTMYSTDTGDHGTSFFLLFLFFRGDCERRGWYDSSQSALRPHSGMAQCTYPHYVCKF